MQNLGYIKACQFFLSENYEKILMRIKKFFLQKFILRLFDYKKEKPSLFFFSQQNLTLKLFFSPYKLKNRKLRLTYFQSGCPSFMTNDQKIKKITFSKKIKSLAFYLNHFTLLIHSCHCMYT